MTGITVPVGLVVTPKPWELPSRKAIGSLKEGPWGLICSPLLSTFSSRCEKLKPVFRDENVDNSGLQIRPAVVDVFIPMRKVEARLQGMRTLLPVHILAKLIR